jgi:two-component system, NarL family, nitrate/nitrite response regulator NarL
MGPTEPKAITRAGFSVGLAIRSRAYREALALYLHEAGDFAITDLGDGPVDTLIERLLALVPDAALVDLPLPVCATLIRETHRAQPSIKIIALNLEDDTPSVVSLFEIGLTGYLPPSCSIDEIRSAIQKALAGEVDCDPRVTAAIVRRLSEVGDRDGNSGAAMISPREARVLSFLETGLTNKQIAVELGVEESTIKNHVHNILRKLGVHHRREAVRRYRRDLIL